MNDRTYAAGAPDKQQVGVQRGGPELKGSAGLVGVRAVFGPVLGWWVSGPRSGSGGLVSGVMAERGGRGHLCCLPHRQRKAVSRVALGSRTW